MQCARQLHRFYLFLEIKLVLFSSSLAESCELIRKRDSCLLDIQLVFLHTPVVLISDHRRLVGRLDVRVILSSFSIVPYFFFLIGRRDTLGARRSFHPSYTKRERERDREKERTGHLFPSLDFLIVSSITPPPHPLTSMIGSFWPLQRTDIARRATCNQQPSIRRPSSFSLSSFFFLLFLF